jgi:hypothetical protein
MLLVSMRLAEARVAAAVTMSGTCRSPEGARRESDAGPASVIEYVTLPSHRHGLWVVGLGFERS